MDEDKGKNNQELDDEELDDEELDDEDTTGKDNDNADGGKSNKQKDGKTFTQAEVNQLAAREKRQGRAAALKELGINPKDANSVESVKALIASQKTDEQKAAEQNSEQAKAIAELEQRTVIAEAKSEALAQGVQSKYVDDLVTLALSKLVEEGADAATIISEYKTKYPVWFNKADDDNGKEKDEKKKTGQRGTGTSVNKTGKGDKSKAQSLGARLAAKRNTGGESSYWNGRKS